MDSPIRNSRFNKTTLVTLCLLGLMLIIVAGAMMRFFENLPMEGTLGIDLIIPFLRRGIAYDVVNGLRNPPWSVLPMMPLLIFSDKAAWGLLVFITLMVLVLIIPRHRTRWVWLVSVIAVTTAFPTLRVVADAQNEVLVFGGVYLLCVGYKHESPWIVALGILIGTAKPQAVSLLLIIFALYILQTWSFKKWFTMGLMVLAVVIPMMLWRGADWLAALGGTYQAGTPVDAGLMATLGRLGMTDIPVLAWGLWGLLLITTLGLCYRYNRTFSREKAGMLIAASLLLAPYAASNSALSVFAIGIIPFFHKHLRVGFIMIILVNVMYPFNSWEYVHVYSTYWTGYLLLSWAVLNWHLIQTEIRQVQPQATHA